MVVGHEVRPWFGQLVIIGFQVLLVAGGFGELNFRPLGIVRVIVFGVTQNIHPSSKPIVSSAGHPNVFI